MKTFQMLSELVSANSRITQVVGQGIARQRVSHRKSPSRAAVLEQTGAAIGWHIKAIAVMRH